MSPQRTHAASIRWSSSQERLGLPDEVMVVDPAWLAGEVPKRDASWSLVCEFAATPRRQGNPSLAQVRYLFPEAPHEQLAPGAKLQLFERGTTGVAHVEIID